MVGSWLASLGVACCAVLVLMLGAAALARAATRAAILAAPRSRAPAGLPPPHHHHLAFTRTAAAAAAGMAHQPPSSDVLVVYCTVPDAAAADKVADAVIGPRLAACVNIVPSVTSVYRWQGAVQRDAETLLLIKTTAGRLDALTAAIKAAHPYEVPEVLAVPAAGGSPAYLKWVVDETAAPSDQGG